VFNEFRPEECGLQGGVVIRALLIPALILSFAAAAASAYATEVLAGSYPGFFTPGAVSDVEWESMVDRPYPFSGTIVAPIDGKNFLSASAGFLKPADDFPGQDESPIYSFTYLRYFYKFLGIDTTLQVYSTAWEEGGLDNRVETGGVEFLLTVQPNRARFQPYIGAGIGSYLNNYTIKSNVAELFDETDNAYGVVMKAGFRANLARGLYLGGYVKYFENDQDFDVFGQRRSLDIGGTAVMAEIGYRF
jgi:opacity protein-like surface antigen